jgi:predicted  nucleic acid-binding Zn-ribbon protein
MRRTFLSVSLAVTLLIVSVLATSALGRQVRQDPDVLSALLTEVRGLRTAIEQMSSAGARVQLAMGRLQLNEQRITTYMRRVDEIRDRRLPAELDVQKRQRELAAFTDALRQSRPPQPPEIEDELKRMKGELAEATAYLQRLQTEEAQLSRDIATEQDRWAEINRTLEELDRVLIRR